MHQFVDISVLNSTNAALMERLWFSIISLHASCNNVSVRHVTSINQYFASLQ